MEGFAEELQRAAVEGVKREENLPFLHQPADREAPGVLLVHGFSASPWELRELGDELAASGLRVLGVRLPGHGTTPEDLARRTWEEWLSAVERGLELISACGSRRIYGVGMSTGALLLLHLARHRELAGLVLISPFLRLRHPLARFAGLLRHLRPFQNRTLQEGLEPFYYRRRPLHGVQQIRRLTRTVAPHLGEVTAPTLILSALEDETVRFASALSLFRRLGSRERQLHLFGPGAPHVLTDRQNPGRREVFALVGSFIGGREKALHSPGVRRESGPEAKSAPAGRSCR